MELIDRQAAIDEIDEWIKAFKENGHKESASDAHFIKCGIYVLPSAQPEIIYCGECAKMQVDSIYHDYWCEETGMEVWVNHYCGFAERKEDEHKD